MALTKEHLEELYNKYVQNQCTQEELEALVNELGSEPETDNETEITRLFDITWGGLEVFPDKYKLPDLLLPKSNDYESPVIEIYAKKKTWLRIAAAASIVFILGVGTYLWLVRISKTDIAKRENTKPASKQDAAPGGNKAVLILANGNTIVLDNAANGTLANEGNAKVIKTSNGQLVYTAPGGEASAAVTYNTLSTPRGGQYQLSLPDGSKVWLNSASSITFPTAFTGNERKVSVTGEAYFEIVPLPLRTGKKMPFKVDKGNVTIEVLGTHFNVNAYDDEDAMRTTLLEGKVRTSMGNGQWSILKPGQQAVIHQSQLTIHDDVDLESIMAWKNGLFHFENADIKTVMRQLSRWYDIEVEYKGAIKNEPLFIEIPRSTNLSDVLKVIESTAGLRVKFEGKKVTVL
jgi:ferric-dicitrate binding protein FerR (iron transport regulator)